MANKSYTFYVLCMAEHQSQLASVRNFYDW